ncbi:hypothetical protein ABB37_09390 [Leptomonas pyrrhocoris]|uniref:Uncharacterized protein n=1 Tax=Leptomonas pyrrhocoris TaxID=157538 RepID=A0A0M9FQM5_LEPPY|nr:hypothetical protein ABB37_09390 [Leptomonas pyrrhocoris]XP_015652534.1 hypothetical protein ABB37_09390 [Leptomonas pyrrhocoris]KPA74094.1 hypothetical protein ABB37_09390 [Leptomonas pyrrhocoris]KPA74095.1 hypothetical protein ABB37_09390 [Leptomonas pyrrhocoris]|eukprot:XP_015652533.1 hypothetical protein ABB37_09390 [Leptomonas pyrrhocoris]
MKARHCDAPPRWAMTSLYDSSVLAGSISNEGCPADTEDSNVASPKNKTLLCSGSRDESPPLPTALESFPTSHVGVLHRTHVESSQEAVRNSAGARHETLSVPEAGTSSRNEEISSPSMEATLRAAQACEERLRRAQTAEVAVLTRLYTCTASLLDPSTVRHSCSLPPAGADSRIESQCLQESSGLEVKEEMRESAHKSSAASTQSDAGLGTHPAIPHERTLNVWLPILSAPFNRDTTDASPPVRGRQFRVPSAGLTDDADLLYGALHNLIAPHNAPPLRRGSREGKSDLAPKSSNVAAFTSSQPLAELALRVAHTSTKDVGASANALNTTFHEADKYATGMLSRTFQPTSPPTKSEALQNSVAFLGGCEHCTFPPQLPQRNSLAEGSNRSVPSPLRSATPTSTLGDTEDEGVFFPTPPRRTAQKGEAAGKWHDMAAHCAPLAVASPVAKAADPNCGESPVGTGGGATALSAEAVTPSRVLVEQPSASEPLRNINASTAKLLRKTSAFDSLSSRRTFPNGCSLNQTEVGRSPHPLAPRVELTATDILATITALPPPPLRSFGSRRTKSAMKRSATTGKNRDDALQSTNNARRGPSKRDRENCFDEGDIRRGVDAHSRTAPFEGLPCLGVDVDAAAAAAAQVYCSQQPPPPTASLGVSASLDADHFMFQQRRNTNRDVVSAPPLHGYVRTRQQRAEDVRQTEAIFRAVRRAAAGGGGGGGAEDTPQCTLSSNLPQQPLNLTGEDTSAAPSASQASYDDSLPNTPSQYWEIDFP